MPNVTDVIVTQTHSLPIAEAKARVQKWLDWNYLWPPKVRINNLQWTWNPLNSNALMFSGTVGLSKYAFKGNIIITSKDITITATDPSTSANAILGVKNGWTLELGKILNKVQPSPIAVITVPLPSGMSQAQALQAVRAGATGAMAKGGKKPRTAGNQVFFFYPLDRTSIGLGEKQVYGMATITPAQVEVAVRAPVGGFASTLGTAGATIAAERYAKQWEQNVSGWLAGSKMKPPAPPSPPVSAVQRTPAAAKSDSGGSALPWVIGGLVAAGSILAIAMSGRSGKRRAA